MKNHEGSKRGFHWSSKAYYSNVVNGDSIMFGMYHKDGGTSGEMEVKWIDLGKYGFAPQLQIFNDGWNALSLFKDLIEELGNHDDENVTPEQFAEILKSCGFEDLTQYKSPYTK